MEAGGGSNFLSAAHAAAATPGEHEKATSYSDAARTTVGLPRRIFEAASPGPLAHPARAAADRGAFVGLRDALA